MKKKLLLLVASILVVMFMTELALRLTWHNSYRSDGPSQYVWLKTQLANRDYAVDRSPLGEEGSTPLRTNERCYILPSQQHENPEVTIAFLGGSTTECSIVKEELRFPALVSTLLGERGLRVNTLNAAAAGNTVHDSVNVLFNHVVFDEPDIVVMMHATNDYGILRRHGHYRTRAGQPIPWKHRRRAARQWFSRHLYVVAFARQAMRGLGWRVKTEAEMQVRNSQAGAAEFPYEDFRERLGVFIDMSFDFGIEPVLLTQPLTTSSSELRPRWADAGLQDRLNADIRLVGTKKGALVIDLVAELEAKVPGWRADGAFLYDGMHVNDAGSRAYAELIADQLEPIVRRLAR